MPRVKYGHGCSKAHDPGLECRHGRACFNCMPTKCCAACDEVEDDREVTIYLTEPAAAALTQLTESGLFGQNREEVVAWLVHEGIRRQVLDGFVPKKLPRHRP